MIGHKTISHNIDQLVRNINIYKLREGPTFTEQIAEVHSVSAVAKMQQHNKAMVIIRTREDNSFISTAIIKMIIFAGREAELSIHGTLIISITVRVVKVGPSQPTKQKTPDLRRDGGFL